MQLILPQICWHLIRGTVPPVLQAETPPSPLYQQVPGSSWGNLLGALQQERPYGWSLKACHSLQVSLGHCKISLPSSTKDGSKSIIEPDTVNLYKHVITLVLIQPLFMHTKQTRTEDLSGPKEKPVCLERTQELRNTETKAQKAKAC